jgi:hypothetical protein
VRTLEVVVLDEKAHPPLAVVEVRKDRPREKLLPHRLPEALDLPAGLRMVRPALHVPDAVAAQLFLKVRRAAPRRVLPSLVGQDLPRRAVLRNAPSQRLHHQRAALVMRHRQAHQVARVIVQKRRHIHPLVLAQQESKKIRLPELVRLSALEAMLLGLRFRLGWLTLLAQPLFPQHPAHRGLRGADAKEALHDVPNPAAAGLRLRLLDRHDRLATRIRRLVGALAADRDPSLGTARPVPLHPADCRRVRHAELLTDLANTNLLVHHRTR